jgi:hypothetical protein
MDRMRILMVWSLCVALTRAQQKGQSKFIPKKSKLFFSYITYATYLGGLTFKVKKYGG